MEISQASPPERPSLFDGMTYKIYLTTDAKDTPNWEAYEVINIDTGVVEFKTSQWPAALEVLFRFEEGIDKFKKEYQKLHGATALVKPSLREVKKFN